MVAYRRQVASRGGLGLDEPVQDAPSGAGQARISEARSADDQRSCRERILVGQNRLRPRPLGIQASALEGPPEVVRDSPIYPQRLATEAAANSGFARQKDGGAWTQVGQRARCRKRPLEEQGRHLEQPAFRCSGDRLAEGEDRTGVRVLRADRVQPATVDPTEVVEPPKLRIEGLDQEPERP